MNDGAPAALANGDDDITLALLKSLGWPAKCYLITKGENGSTMEAVLAKRPTPPKPTARKALPMNADYERKATALVRDAMRERGASVIELRERLTAMGVMILEGGLANEISRGGLSSVFCYNASMPSR